MQIDIFTEYDKYEPRAQAILEEAAELRSWGHILILADLLEESGNPDAEGWRGLAKREEWPKLHADKETSGIANTELWVWPNAWWMNVYPDKRF